MVGLVSEGGRVDARVAAHFSRKVQTQISALKNKETFQTSMKKNPRRIPDERLYFLLPPESGLTGIVPRGVR